MKTCKKLLAVLLSILMMLSVTVISASAEEDEVWICIDSVKAVKYAEGDKETVTSWR